MDSYSKEAKARLSIIYYKYSIMCFNSREYEDSLNNIKRAIDYYDNSPDYFILRARCYIKLSDVKKALNDANRALGMDKNNKDAIEIKKYYTLK
jgi:tetratricopeptide (TPR) repeat protein